MILRGRLRNRLIINHIQYPPPQNCLPRRGIILLYSELAVQIPSYPQILHDSKNVRFKFFTTVFKT